MEVRSIVLAGAHRAASRLQQYAGADRLTVYASRVHHSAANLRVGGQQVVSPAHYSSILMTCVLPQRVSFAQTLQSELMGKRFLSSHVS